MKKYIYTVALLLAGVFTSCDDFLTVDSPDDLTTNSFWKGKEDVEKAMASIYSPLYFGGYYNTPEVKYPVEVFREDYVKLGPDPYNYPNWIELYNFTFTNGNSQFSQYWSYHYWGISHANQVIEKTEGISKDAISDADRKALLSEAHFLRGYYHMMLLMNWEKIEIRDKYITSSAPSVLNVALSSRAETWDFIIDELKKGTDMPAKRDNMTEGRATSGAAYAYIGWAMLTRAYEEPAKKDEYLKAAVEAFNQVQGYELEKNFHTMFDGSNKNCPESIFEVQFTMDDANGAYYRSTIHRWIGTTDLKGWEEILPNDFLIAEYKKEKNEETGMYDQRFYETIYSKCDYYNDPEAKRVYGSTYDEVFDGKDKPAFRKFLPADVNQLLNNDMLAINIPLMRYANVMLMKAEALNELGQTAQAIPLINEIRSVHGNMPAMKGSSQAEVRAEIEHQRLLEFPLENSRWYDLRRWGKTEEALKAVGRKGFDKSKHLFYLIPQTELNANDAIKQE